MRVLVTGGAGFIGSTFIRRTIREPQWEVLNLDNLTYAARPSALSHVSSSPGYRFVLGDIADSAVVRRCLKEFEPDAIVHLAAESHVDRSICGPAAFIHTNLLGTYTLLDEAKRYFQSLPGAQRHRFRFMHVSTDEVFGSCERGSFQEDSPYAPNSPYSASKAGSDHLARAWHQTYGLPVLITNCSNNYGPYQFPEKLIPVVIHRSLQGQRIPVYGKGDNVRDWVFVDDHVAALKTVLEAGTPGERYNIGARRELSNLELITLICRVVDELRPFSPYRPHEQLISFVEDRPGHDKRYSVDCSKIERELGWRAKTPLEDGVRATVNWYVENSWWLHETAPQAESNRSCGQV
jgi:dTDP-glucose 4,6-dehydratase